MRVQCAQERRAALHKVRHGLRNRLVNRRSEKWWLLAVFQCLFDELDSYGSIMLRVSLGR